MSVIQIVSLIDGKETLQKSLQKISTEKIVFVTSKEKLKDALSIRNEFALAYKMPTEVKVLDQDMGKIFSELRGYKNAILHIIDHNDLNYYLINASFILGIPIYFSNGHELQQLPNLTSKLRDMLSLDQLKVLNSLKTECTHEELAMKTKLDNSLLFFYLYGKNGSTGLLKMGLVADKNDKVSLTEIGKLVVES